MQKLMDQIFHDPNKGKNQRTRIMEAGAIAAYHNRTDFPVVKAFLSDGAPQFKKLTEEQALCWIHDARNYKKLGVSAYDYISDRVSKSFKMPSLAELIGAKKSLTFDCKDNF
jgi:hypothetical protein